MSSQRPRLTVTSSIHPPCAPFFCKSAVTCEYPVVLPWLHQSGPSVQAAANVDCVTAKKRVEECDADCPSDQSEPSIMSGHEVRHAGSQLGCRCRMLLFAALIVNLVPCGIVVVVATKEYGGTNPACYIGNDDKDSACMNPQSWVPGIAGPLCTWVVGLSDAVNERCSLPRMCVVTSRFGRLLECLECLSFLSTSRRWN